jgi:hypothetical protein
MNGVKPRRYTRIQLPHLSRRRWTEAEKNPNGANSNYTTAEQRRPNLQEKT